jgi:L-ascorbate metabolism protein UlaG (beta-lactamase superfamily)
MDMKLIPMDFQLSLAVLPIGDNFTMGIADAVKAADFVECQRVLGYHYDTFGYIEIDHRQARETFKKAGKQLHLPGIGESIEL